MTYKPTPRIAEILDAAYDIVESVPYQLSVRWIFYTLLQQGHYSSKKEYRNFKERCIEARRRFYKKWRPWTLADEGRHRVIRSGGHESVEECLEILPGAAVEVIDLDHFYHQDRYVEIWFESRGMASQFRYHTKDINLVPLGGDPSLPLMWDTAKALEEVAERYGKDVLILYFGDCDFYGDRIMKSAEKTIREWCGVDFEIKWCGLTLEQAKKYGLPENFERPDEYQWESFGGMGEAGAKIAGEIIESSVGRFVDVELTDEVRERTEEEQDRWSEIIREALEDAVKKSQE